MHTVQYFVLSNRSAMTNKMTFKSIRHYNVVDLHKLPNTVVRKQERSSY